MTQEETDKKLLLENQLCFPLYACARKVTALYTPVLKPLGITYTQYLVFMVLWETGPTTVGELGRRLYLDNGTLTPLLKKLEAEGFLTRKRSREDERVVTIALTDKGSALKSNAAHIPETVGSCVRLSPEDASTLYTLLYKMMQEL